VAKLKATPVLGSTGYQRGDRLLVGRLISFIEVVDSGASGIGVCGGRFWNLGKKKKVYKKKENSSLGGVSQVGDEAGG